MAKYNAEKTVGRPSLGDNGVTKQTGFKCSGELKARMRTAVKRLNKLGYDTCESELVRLLVEYGIERIDTIYKRAKGKKLKESA